MSDDQDDILSQIVLPEETGERETVYYILGIRPIKVIYIDSFPEIIKSPDPRTKEWVHADELIPVINDSLDIKKVDRNQFVEACLEVGVKPL